MADESKSSITPYEFDTRMIEWNLNHNVISRDQLKAHLASLSDDASHSESFDLNEGQSSH
ncbi:MAG: hypothetical protein IT289_11795 [Oligoflexia bacterium]|nr:hypothetical protein [Oligoflexia bacterium]